MKEEGNPMTKHPARTLVPSVRMLASKTIGLGLILAALSRPSHAQLAAPEIDAGSILSGLALLSCGMLILTSRARKK